MSKIAEIAKSWVGREFRPGQKEQCANFVRAVLKEAKAPLADIVTKEPLDGHWTGPALASGLAGRDLGEPVIKKADLKPGDILFWNDTYYTGFPALTITHIGIAIGNGRFVHRPTAARPVEEAGLVGFWSRQFRCGIRPKPELLSAPDPKAPKAATPAHPFTVWLNGPNGASLQVHEALKPGVYSLYGEGDGWSGKLVPDE